MLSHLKNHLILARLHQPAGFLLLMWPCWFGVIIAPTEISSNHIYWLTLFFIGSVLLRASGCIINDIWDRKIDAQVERTKNRPIASGKISVLSATLFTGILLICGLAIFLQLNLTAQLISLMALVFAIIYPLMKRFFFLPQLFLGITFNLGILIGYVTVTGYLDIWIFIAYIGCIFWTLGYDTIYGNQDKKDDQKVGVKSTALTFGKSNKPIILASYIIFICSIIFSSTTLGLEISYITLTPALFLLLYQVKIVDLNSPKECMDKFKQNAYIIGSAVFVGILTAKIY